jgi:hypothetical protein
MVQVYQHLFYSSSEEPVQASHNIGTRMLSMKMVVMHCHLNCSILLLAALIGCIVIALRSKPETK